MFFVSKPFFGAKPLLQRFVLPVFVLLLLFAGSVWAQPASDSPDIPARPIEPIKISPDDVALNLSRAVQIYLDQGKSFRVSTAPGPDGIIRRIEVQANDAHGSGNWAVFAIANPTDEQIDRLIVAPHYRLAGSGILKPDLGSVRIHSITPSEGFALDRQASPDSDIFRLTINPGAVITFVAELGTAALPQLYLWEPEAYKDTVNSYTLYHGILLGISGLLALLLTVLVVVKGTSLFPTTAFFAWAVLAYICADFNFFNKIFAATPEHELIWRAATEVALAAGLSAFLFAYLHLHRWHNHFRFGGFVWICALVGVVALVFFDPVRAAGLARLLLGLIAVIGAALIGYLTFRGYDRAIMLIPAWLLFIIWLVGAYAAVSGRLDNDIIQPALAGGLVLIVLLISFTVMQHAFAGGGVNQGLFSDLERQALAVMGTDNIVWDWDVARDKVVTSPDLSIFLGSAAKNLAGPMRNWLPNMHNEDRDRFRMALDYILDKRGGRLDQSFRLRSGDGQYHWFALHARPVIGNDGEIIRCVGMMEDMTKTRKVEERLLKNAIYDSLTGLPNRQLLLDRLQNYCNLARLDEKIRPTLLVIDFDNFHSINRRYGLSVGDTFLLAVARRLSRHLKPLDSLCRLSGDRFVLLLASQNNLSNVAAFALNLKKAVSTPINFASHTIKLTASIGLLPWINDTMSAEERLNDAVLAMYQAKYNGGDRIEPFQPAMRAGNLADGTMEKELQEALQKQQLNLVYLPVFNIKQGNIVGFEAGLQWDHHARGILNIQDFMTGVENSGLIMEVARFMLAQAARDINRIEEHFPGRKIFTSVTIPSPQLVSSELLPCVQSVLVHNPLKKGQMQIGFSENMIEQNPELAFSLAERLKALGIGLVLNNFGAEHASLYYLTRFPFDMIQLDSVLFNDDSDKSRLLLKPLIDMARDIGAVIIADGVENENTALLLQKLGCNFIKSYTFCDNLEIGEAIALLEKHSAT
ncbi:EAL domain-containing protein [Candidatus Tokpelaia sp.]|uniref:EAL domain-containing protein n=1 Tax=Candidatus Tokpelaia sp. TaxID=2233777 RepID=UPI003CC7EA86